MANNFDWSVIIELATKGGAQTVQDIEQVEDAVRALSKENKLSERAEDDAKKAIADKTKALEDSTGATENSTKSINAQRYALYEVAAAYGAVSAALVTLGAKTISTFAEIEQGFAKVERTSEMYGDAFAPLEADLLSLSRTIPTLTSDIQDLAARGAQMGIAAEDVADFAEVMAKFIATSPDVDVNSVAEAFGRISKLTAEDDFLGIASAIAQVGVNSAATDAQILKTAEGVARATAAFGFSADEIIGLSAAMASLGVQPEAARGVMVQFVNTVDRGAAGITDAMKVMADQMGMAEEAATRLWKTDPTEFIKQLSRGLTASGDLTRTLDEMGLVGLRLRPFFAALTNDFKNNADINTVLASALEDSNQGFREKLELDRQFGPMAETLNAQLQLLQNAWLELAFTVGSELAPSLKGLLDVLTSVVHGVVDFINTPVGGFLTKMIAGIATVIAAYAALRSSVALTNAVLIAFRTSAGTELAGGLIGSLKTLNATIWGTSTASTRAGAAMYYLRRSIKAAMSVTVIGGALAYVSEWLFNTAETAVRTGETLIWLSEVIVDLASKIGPIFGIGAAMATSGLRKMGHGLAEWGNKSLQATEGVEDFNSALMDVPPTFDDWDDSIESTTDNLGGLGSTLQDVQEELVSVSDYASDLKNVFDRAFQIRFGTDMAQDATFKILLNIAKESEQAKQRIRDLRSEIRTMMADIGVLQSDINVQEYFLGVALEYGDTKRAEAIQANLSKLQADLAKKQDDLRKKNNDLTKAQDDNSKVLSGNSEQNIKNRETILDLVKSYQDQIIALAESGASQSELRRESERLREDFVKQATQLGFNRDEIKKYENAIRDMTTIINKVPRNVSTSLEIKGLNPAKAALKEFENSVKKTMDNARKLAGKGVSIPAPKYGNSGVQAEIEGLKARIAATTDSLNRMRSIGNTSGAINLADQIGRLTDELRRLRGYSSGGFTGSGGKYEPAGIVHRGEYVIPKEMVNQRTGLPYADALGKLVQGSPANASYARGGYVAPATVNGLVDLSARSVQAIAQAVPKYIVMDGRMVGEAVSQNYASESRVGAN